jgi:hypothetical protein
MNDGYQWSMYLTEASVNKVIRHMQRNTPATACSSVNFNRHLTNLRFYTSVLGGRYTQMVASNDAAAEAESDMLTNGMDVDRKPGRVFALIEDPLGNNPVAISANGQGINRLSDCLMEAFQTRAKLLRLVKREWDKEVAKRFPIGTRVLVRGLKTSKWNGTMGVVVDSADCAVGRIAVRTPRTRLSLDPMHLFLCD